MFLFPSAYCFSKECKKSVCRFHWKRGGRKLGVGEATSFTTFKEASQLLESSFYNAVKHNDVVIFITRVYKCFFFLNRSFRLINLKLPNRLHPESCIYKNIFNKKDKSCWTSSPVPVQMKAVPKANAQLSPSKWTRVNILNTPYTYDFMHSSQVMMGYRALFGVEGFALVCLSPILNSIYLWSQLLFVSPFSQLLFCRVLLKSCSTCGEGACTDGASTRATSHISFFNN